MLNADYVALFKNGRCVICGHLSGDHEPDPGGSAAGACDDDCEFDWCVLPPAETKGNHDA